MNTPKPLRRTLRVCRHEAAHAVLGELLGGRIADVKVFKRETSGGIIAWTRMDLRRKISPLAQACVTLAGDVCEQRHGYVARYCYSPGDAKNMVRTGLSVFDINLLADMVRRWLGQSHVRRAVEAVARALVKKDLSGAEIRRIIGKEGRHAARKREK